MGFLSPKKRKTDKTANFRPNLKNEYHIWNQRPSFWSPMIYKRLFSLLFKANWQDYLVIYLPDMFLLHNLTNDTRDK